MLPKVLFAVFSCLLIVTRLNAQDNPPVSQTKTFDKFYQVFNDNYAFFDLHQLNWKAQYANYRPLINDGISNDSLFKVMSAMLTPLGDSHVNLIDARQKRKFNAARPSAFAAAFHNDSLKNALWVTVDKSLTQNGFSEAKGYGPVFKGKHLFYFAKSTNYGYLRFNRCFARITDGEIDEKDFETQILDSLITRCGGLKGMIVDVRFNIGGDDKFSYEVAGRFAGKPVAGHYKNERIAGTNKFTKLQKWVVKPKGKYHFTRSVVVLTNSKTVSAAEIFTLAMRQLPMVKIVGDNTEGNLSDMYSEDLPNGWSVTLSNQKYYSPKMVCYEGVGVPVNIKVINSLADLASGKDPVVAKGLSILRGVTK
ncbi:S41 family peptidase [Mucilaginibacter sp.]|uniref:S41 family peptidase n=1 Tax=Mucilaginibacter sp. TaxID=1882438 RepID=UPI0035BC1B65